MKHALWTFALLAACSAPESDGVPQWNVRFALNDSTAAEVRFEGDADALFIRNGEERIALELAGPGVYRLPVFGGSLSVEWNGDAFSGQWVDSLRPGTYAVPFAAERLRAAAAPGERTCSEWNFYWEGDSIATDRLQVCVWGDSAAGTVASPTGDLRYLAGTLRDGTLRLSTFDGAHLYAFSARATEEGFVDGTLHSGIHGFTRWHAAAGAAPAPAHAATLTLDATDRIAVRTATGTDSLLRAVPAPGNIHLISIAGTWCPNCMDEARMCAQLLEGRSDVQWSVVLFERDSIPRTARLTHWAASCGTAALPFIGGSASKERASQVFSWLPGGIAAFPTTVVVRDDGSAWVHTGFDGPATGTAHARMRAAFEEALRPIPEPASGRP